MIYLFADQETTWLFMCWPRNYMTIYVLTKKLRDYLCADQETTWLIMCWPRNYVTNYVLTKKLRD
jgi:hypothetical protein